jgi:hypothetical protein
MLVLLELALAMERAHPWPPVAPDARRSSDVSRERLAESSAAAGLRWLDRRAAYVLQDSEAVHLIDVVVAGHVTEWVAAKGGADVRATVAAGMRKPGLKREGDQGVEGVDLVVAVEVAL